MTLKHKQMKNLIILNLLMLVSVFSYTQTNEYQKRMLETIAIMEVTDEINNLQKAANQFNRIGDVMQNDWLPYYYSAYCDIRISYLKKDDKQKDFYLDKAKELISLADNLSPNNDEIYVLKGFLLQARIKIDPMVRGILLHNKCLKMFEQAKNINPDNPRSYLWQGVQLFNTPTFWGGGKDKALPLLELAIEKFNLSKRPNSIYPDWGEEYAIKIISEFKN